MLEPGTILLGKYRIERILGEGGMGVVLQAHHVHLDQPVAIKFLRSTMLNNQEVVKRFLREAQAAVRLKNEHVCNILDVGTMESGAPYMVMEFMEGMDLGQLVAQQGALAPGLVVDLLLQACAGLAEAHSLGIVHRDIKPANLFITSRRDSTLLLKVLDFGISKATSAVDEGLTSTQAVLGTPAYMSPEQMRSSKLVDARTDIWALGVVLYELLAGHRPFRGEAFSEICLKIAVDPTPPLAAQLPDGLEGVVARCLEKDPDRRYQTVAALAADLVPYAHSSDVAASILGSVSRMVGGAPAGTQTGRALTSAGVSVVGTPISTLSGSAGQVERSSRRRRAGVIMGTAVALAVAAVLAFVLLRGGGSGDRYPDDPQPTAASAPAVQTPALKMSEATPAGDTADAGVATADANDADDAGDNAGETDSTDDRHRAQARAEAATTTPRRNTRKSTGRKKKATRKKPSSPDKSRSAPDPFDSRQ